MCLKRDAIDCVVLDGCVDDFSLRQQLENRIEVSLGLVQGKIPLSLMSFFFDMRHVRTVQCDMR